MTGSHSSNLKNSFFILFYHPGIKRIVSTETTDLKVTYHTKTVIVNGFADREKWQSDSEEKDRKEESAQSLKWLKGRPLLHDRVFRQVTDDQSSKEPVSFVFERFNKNKTVFDDFRQHITIKANILGRLTRI